LRGTKLRRTEEEKRDIGIIVTRNLKPSVQCSKTVEGATVVLENNFHYRDKHTFVKLHKQMCAHI
jgi:hypothetical protein